MFLYMHKRWHNAWINNNKFIDHLCIIGNIIYCSNVSKDQKNIFLSLEPRVHCLEALFTGNFISFFLFIVKNVEFNSKNFAQKYKSGKKESFTVIVTFLLFFSQPVYKCTFMIHGETSLYVNLKILLHTIS